MRIALVVHKFPPSSLGGTEIYTRNLARALSSKHEVSVFYRDDGDGRGFREEWQDRDGFAARRVSRAFHAPEASPLAVFADTFFNRDVEQSFERFLEEVDPDLVHFQHLMLLSYRLIRQAEARGLPIVLTLHDYWFICSNSQLIWPSGQICRGKAWGMNCARCATARIGRPWMAVARPVLASALQLRDALVRRAALRADQMIAPSQFLIDCYTNEGFPSERLMLLENGLDARRISFRSSTPPPSDRLRVTYLGSLAWQKGVHVLVDAFRDLPPHRAVLRVFGNPDTFPDYSAALRERANQSNTTFEGQVPNEEVGCVLAETDVLAVPSLWYENSPVVIQEARAAGVPVVASDHGALAEKVRDGIDGMLLPVGDVRAWQAGLEQLMGDPGLLTRLRAKRSPPVTLDQHVDRLRAIYARLVDRQLYA